jgi:hypothetical protein
MTAGRAYGLVVLAAVGALMGCTHRGGNNDAPASASPTVSRPAADDPGWAACRAMLNDVEHNFGDDPKQVAQAALDGGLTRDTNVNLRLQTVANTAALIVLNGARQGHVTASPDAELNNAVAQTVIDCRRAGYL